MSQSFPLIFADDLTGAMEVGLQTVPALVINDWFSLLKPKLDTWVTGDENMEFEMIAELPSDLTSVINTQTRDCSYDETQKKIRKALSFASPEKISYFKIDSTLRGEFGAAIDVLRKLSKIDLVLVAPALPQNGRVTKKGVHYLISKGQKIPIHKTVYGNDLCPSRKTSSIPDLINDQIGEEVGLIALSTVQNGTKAILDAFSGFRKEAVVVADATTSADLEAIARALMRTKKSILPVGSAGLFSALCRVSGVEKERMRSTRQSSIYYKSSIYLLDDKRRKGKVLFLVGSLNPKTDQQVDFLLESPGKQVKLIELNLSKLLAGDARCQAEISHARKMVKDAIKAGLHPILRTSRKIDQGKKMDSTAAWALGQTINDEQILSRLKLVFVTGGETALTVAKVLGAFGMTVDDAVEPLVPIGRFVGGKVNDLPVVTKAGGFGSKELLEKLFYLST